MFRNVLTTILQVLLISFLAFLANEAWTAYEQEKLTVLFDKEGTLVNVRVDQVTNDKRTWKDYIGNSKYLGFTFNGKPYHMRYLQKGEWVGEGSKIILRYHAGLDMFRQQGVVYHKIPNRRVSKLIHWTVVGTFSYANRWLFAFLVRSVIIVLLLFSVLTFITHWRLLSMISNWFVITCFFGAAVFFTWDSWANYTYYRGLKMKGYPVQLIMANKNRVSYDVDNRNNDIPFFYYYTATVNYNREDREIMISSDEYGRLSRGDKFMGLYDASVDDMMSAGYSPAYWRVFFIVFLWTIVVYTARRKKRAAN